MVEHDRPRIFLIAGEPSGDMLGGRLMAGLRALSPKGVAFFGIGGPRMSAEGLESLFPMEELAVMGLVEVLPHLPRLHRRVVETAAAVRECQPDALVTIDSPGFNDRILDRLQGAGFPKIQLVAPQAWAWRPGRARHLARRVDHLLVLFPFEIEVFRDVGVPLTFVGHPVVEEPPDTLCGAAYRNAIGVADEAPLVCLLPGSRRAVVERHLPIMRAMALRLKEKLPAVAAVIPTIEGLAADVRRAVSDWPIRCVVEADPQSRFDAYAASDVGVASSGTVTLELALAGLPHVVIYRANPVTAFVARRLIRVPHVGLVNLLLARDAIPELLQERCRPDGLAEAVLELRCDHEARKAQIAAMREATRLLRPGDGALPSQRAAEVVLRLVAEARGTCLPGPQPRSTIGT